MNLINTEPGLRACSMVQLYCSKRRKSRFILKKAVEPVCRGCAVILSTAVVTTASSKS